MLFRSRIGATNGFADVLDASGNPVEYMRSPAAGHERIIGPVSLPAEANGKPYIQLRWKYYLVSGTSGQRAQLRLDDILVSEKQAPVRATVNKAAFAADGRLTLTFSGGASQAYIIETSSDLQHWSSAGEISASSSGTGFWTAPGAPAESHRFYRIAAKE